MLLDQIHQNLGCIFGYLGDWDEYEKEPREFRASSWERSKVVLGIAGIKQEFWHLYIGETHFIQNDLRGLEERMINHITKLKLYTPVRTETLAKLYLPANEFKGLRELVFKKNTILSLDHLNHFPRILYPWIFPMITIMSCPLVSYQTP